ncbi:unnamed protein product [Eruca vesicaria subsp. sativa]|uniref:Uncharacterized protein n=1 Tax=Eruca vesicaria subsp. sativa TaxID=29727 RepID=A0ABC8K2S6_ERUVS|nr:unnamed protein product [Eruca vesicaria subsp. sativa]
MAVPKETFGRVEETFLLPNVVRDKKARACDCCDKKQAQWFCAADDAFLCQSCDTSVHSANALAGRHVRVRLKNTSPLQEAATWHQGFTRKPRTPRGSGKKNNLSTFHGLVPEISVEDQTDRDSSEVEELVICRVPVLDPMVVETKIELPSVVMIDDQEEDKDNAESYLNGFLPTDVELEDFAADVEILLGGGVDTDSCTMEEVGLSDTEMFEVKQDELEEEAEEETKGMNMDMDIGISDGDQDDTYEEDVIDNVESSGECVKVKEGKEQENVLMLRLNYDLVISTWGGQGLPWTSGEPPEVDLNISGSPVVSMGKNGGESHEKHYVGRGVPSSGVRDGGREAKVLRYREKRRKRLFSKKIRYEVRRLNAEQRPRLKGRFVKRASLAANSTENSH